MSQSVHAVRRVYVDPATGSDTNAGTSANPLATIPVAALRLVRGGTIFVKAPESAPYVGSVAIAPAYDVTVQPWGSEKWHLTGTSTVGYAFRAAGAGMVTLRHGVIVGLNTSGVRVGLTGNPAGTGRLTAYDTYAEGVENGWQTAGMFTSMDCYRCTGLGRANDGFNIHGDPGVTGVATLTDCVGNDCGDEGASPHDDTRLNIVGGEFRRNKSAGMTAVTNSVCNISGGAVFADNGAGLGEGHGGVAFLENTSGSVDGAVMSGNTGPGLTISTTGAVTLGAYTSTGNTTPDVIP